MRMVKRDTVSVSEDYAYPLLRLENSLIETSILPNILSIQTHIHTMQVKRKQQYVSMLTDSFFPKRLHSLVFKLLTYFTARGSQRDLRQAHSITCGK